jgi:hypothetical protein
MKRERYDKPPRVRRTRVALCILSVLGCAFVSVHAQGTPDQDKQVVPEIPPGYMLIEGDIIVPVDFWEGDASYTTSLWPSGDVPYQFDTSGGGNVNLQNQNRMIAAMAIWEAVANVDFRPRSGEIAFIHIQNATVNNSHVGRLGIRQVINIKNWGNQGTLAHELGHALGFWHEQSRPDRNTYIQIHWGNITSGNAHNFNIHGTEYGYYDFGSLMHYGQCAWSVCAANCPTASGCGWGGKTIQVLEPNTAAWQNVIGRANAPSCLDAMTMSFLYPRSDWRFLDEGHTGAGTGEFFDPYPDFFTAVSSSGTPLCGDLWIEPGSYCAVGVHDRGMLIRATQGGVVLGR